MSTAVAQSQHQSVPAPRPLPASPPRWLLPAAGVALSGTASIVCLLAAGPLHGVLFGACLTAVLLTPALTVGGRDWPATLLVTAGVVLGSVLGPLIAMLQGSLNGPLFSTLFAVVAPLVIALAGVSALLALLRLPPALVATVVTLIAMLWLGWPIWLSHWLPGNEGLVAALSPPHPLLTIDAAITRQGGVSWLEHRLMYAKLTVLGQHVFPRQPAGVGVGAIWHGGVGAACLLIVAGVQIWGRKRARR